MAHGNVAHDADDATREIAQRSQLIVVGLSAIRTHLVVPTGTSERARVSTSTVSDPTPSRIAAVEGVTAHQVLRAMQVLEDLEMVAERDHDRTPIGGEVLDRGTWVDTSGPVPVRRGISHAHLDCGLVLSMWRVLLNLSAKFLAGQVTDRWRAGWDDVALEPLVRPLGDAAYQLRSIAAAVGGLVVVPDHPEAGRVPRVCETCGEPSDGRRECGRCRQRRSRAGRVAGAA